MANWIEDGVDYSVIGIDVGSHATGFCRNRQGLVATKRIQPDGDLLLRSIQLRHEIGLLLAATGDVDLICLENPYSIGMKAAKALAVASAFIEEAVLFAGMRDKLRLVPPSTWHKFVRDNIGVPKGQKIKKVLHQALVDSVAPDISDDESDAYWLSRYAYHLVETEK